MMDKKLKILLIDDDQSICALLKNILQETAELSLTPNGLSAESELSNKKFDIVIFDLNLDEEKSGLDYFKEFKQKGFLVGTKTFILTADESIESEVAGHEINVDEYMKKPIDPILFRAIVEKHKRVLTENKSTELQFGNIKIDLGTLMVTMNQVDGKKDVSLTSKEFQILVSLVQNAGEVLTREDLYNSIWNKKADHIQRTLDMHVSSLRKKLGITGQCIKTIRSSGYKIEQTA